MFSRLVPQPLTFTACAYKQREIAGIACCNGLCIHFGAEIFAGYGNPDHLNRKDITMDLSRDSRLRTIWFLRRLYSAVKQG
jgi:hypothetical protein